MSFDIAELGIKIDSSQAVKAARDNDALTAATRRTESAVNGLIRRAVALAGAIGVAFSLQSAIGQAEQLDRAVGELSTLIPQATEELDKMTEAGRRMGIEFGTGSQAQVRAYYRAVSAGATDAAEATARVDAANRLAIGGAADLQSSVSLLGAATNAYAASNLTAADAADTLFVAVRTGDTDLRQISASFGRVIPAAVAAGISFQETAAAVSALTTQGQTTDIAVTGLSATLGQLLNPSQQARDLARQLGIEFNLTGLRARGLAGFMEDIVEKTGGSEEAIARLFGSQEALRAVFALAGEGGERFNQIMLEMENRAGAADTAYEQMAQRISTRWNVVMAAATDAADRLGTVLLTGLVIGGEAALGAMEFLQSGTIAADIALKALAVTAGVTLVTSLGRLAASMIAASAASGIWWTALQLLTVQGGAAIVMTQALGAAIRFALGPIGLAITAIGLITAAWVAYDQAGRRASQTQERLNGLLDETRRAADLTTITTREMARARLEEALAIREQIMAEVELARQRYDNLVESGMADSANPFARRITEDAWEALGVTVEALRENREAIAAIREQIAELGREAARAEREHAEAQDAAFVAIIGRLDQEWHALTLNRHARQERIAIMRAEEQVGRALTLVERQQLAATIDRNAQRERMLSQYDDINRALHDYIDGIEALNALYRMGAISAEQFWDQALRMELPQAAVELDAYLRSMGAGLDPLRIQTEMAAAPNLPGMSAFNDLALDPAMAGQGSEIERMRSEYVERLALIQMMEEAELLTITEARDRRLALEQAAAAERLDLERATYASQMAAASSTFSDIAQITKAFAGEQSGIYRTMFAISKAFAIAESIINIQRAVANALALPFPANIPAMAAVAAEGANIIAAIQAVAGNGFFTAGFTGNGNVGDIAGLVHFQEGVLGHQAMRGIGRQNLDYMNTHHQLPPQAPAPGQQGGGTTVIDLRHAYVTRDSVEKLIEDVNALGGKVKVLDGSIETRVEQYERDRIERGG